MRVAMIDATSNKALAAQYGVKGYPTLKFVRGAKSASSFEVRPYGDSRKKDALLDFARRMHQPAVHVLTDDGKDEAAAAMELKKLMQKAPIVFLLAIPADADAAQVEEAHAHFQRAAEDEKHRLGLLFVRAAAGPTHSASSVVARRACPGDTKAFADRPRVCRLDHDVVHVHENAAHDARRLADWIGANQLPYLAEIGAGNFHSLTLKSERRTARGEGDLLVVGVVDPTDSDRTSAFVAMLRHLARPEGATPLALGQDAAGTAAPSAPPPELSHAVRKRYRFSYIDGRKWGKFVSQFNMRLEALPRVFVLDAAASVFFEDPEVDEQDEIETFLTEVAEGRATAQRQGMAGLPRRLQNMLVRHYPLSLLFLVPVVLLICVCVQCCRSDDDYEYEYEYERSDKPATGTAEAAAGDDGAADSPMSPSQAADKPKNE